jgi:hypothetical protein
MGALGGRDASGSVLMCYPVDCRSRCASYFGLFTLLLAYLVELHWLNIVVGDDDSFYWTGDQQTKSSRSQNRLFRTGTEENFSCFGVGAMGRSPLLR